MEDVKFLEWVEIPGGKKQGDDYVWEGVAYVLFNIPNFGAISNGFKVVRRVSTGDRFIGDGSWRLEEDGIESYKQWIMVDSNIAKERLKDFIVRNVLKVMQKKTQMSGSVQNQQAHQQNTASQQQHVQAEMALTQGNDDDVPF